MDNKDKLIEKLEEYIKFLANDIGKNASFLHIHGMMASKEDFEKGKQLRSEIASLKQEIEKEKHSDKQIYHLSCDKCGDLFWCSEGFPQPQICKKCEGIEKPVKNEEETILVDDPNYPNLGRIMKKSDYIKQFNKVVEKPVLSAEEVLLKYIPYMASTQRPDYSDILKAMHEFAEQFKK